MSGWKINILEDRAEPAADSEVVDVPNEEGVKAE
jgi:hypothetical protein